MAIGFNRIGYVSRSTGRSAVQAYAYISGTKAIDSRTNQIADYRNKAYGVAYAGILAPTDAPEWAHSPDVWSRLEAFVDYTIEARYLLPETVIHFKNTARVAQTHIFALPLELSFDDWNEISQTFISENFTSRNLVTGFAIHADDGNPHLHLTVALHALEGDTFVDTKSRELYQNSFRKEVFSNFADLFNTRLMERGFTNLIDPRSYQERGLDLLPQVHEGWHARDLAEQGKLSNRVIENELIRGKNAQLILQNTSIILKEISQTHATFSETQALAVVQKRMSDNPPLCAFVFDAILKEAHCVGVDLDGNRRYASKEYEQREVSALADTRHLLTTNHALSISPELIRKTINNVNQTKGYNLTEEQEQAVYATCETRRLSLLVGRAGTGKTSSLQAIVQLHKNAGFNVVGMALSAEAASHLAHDADIEARTIASFEVNWKKQDEYLLALSQGNLTVFERAEHQRKLDQLRVFDIQRNSLFIADESGMIGTASMQRILHKARKLDAKVLLVGDDRQFKAIDAGDIFRKQVDLSKAHHGYSELTRIVRQKQAWMVNASEALAEFNPGHALDAYLKKGHVHGLDDEHSVIQGISERYVDQVVHHGNSSGLVITFTNESCAKLNTEIRSALQIHNVIDSVNHDINGKAYARHDQIVFLKNCYSDAVLIKRLSSPSLEVLFEKPLRGVTNGLRGIIQRITPVWDRTTGELIDHELVVHFKKEGAHYEASFKASAYPNVSHGYAITLYKSQGQTVNWAMTYATPHMDATAAYVAMTRHEQALDIYYSQTDFPTYQSLGARLSRFHAKDLVIDYTRDPETQRIYDTVQGYVLVGREMVHALRIGEMASYELHKVERMVLAKEILENFSDHGGFILQQGLTKGHLEITAGLKARTLSHLEERVLVTLEQYIDAATSCRDLWQRIKTTHPGIYAKKHAEYAAFKALQDERGSLAHNLLAHAPIVRSFGKELYTGTGYGFSTIQKQGSTFEVQMLQREAIKRLSPDEQRDVNLYKAMVEHQQFAIQLHKDQYAKDAPLREQSKGQNKVLFKTLVTESEQNERLKMETCTGALSSLVLEKITSLEALAEKLNLTLNHTALHASAQHYNRLILIHVATGTDIPFAHDVSALHRQLGFAAPSPVHEARTTTLAQMTAARELVVQIAADEAAGRKAVTKAVIINAVGLEGLNHIYKEARHAKRLAVNVAFGKETLHKEVHALITYSDACDKANYVWHQVRLEAAQQNCAFNKTSSYPSYEQATAMRDCVAYQISTENTSSSHNPLARLRQANALLAGAGVGVKLVHFEKHISSGFLHQACLTMLDPQAAQLAKDDAMDALLTGLMLDDQRVRTVNILDSHNMTKMYLVEKALEQIGDKMPTHKEALNTYQQALMGYKKTFRDFIRTHGTDFKLLEKDSREALNVREAEKVRDEAAFHLRPLLTDNVPHMLMADLLTHLKVNQSQILHQGDRFESLSWMRAFNETRTAKDSTHNNLLENERPQTHKATGPDHATLDNATLAYQLLERFALEGATKTPSSVGYALKTEGVTLNDLHKTVQNNNQSMVSNAAHTTLVDYQQNVMAFGQAYQTLMREFNDAKSNNEGLEKPKQLYISHMPSYAAFWKVRANLAQIAYTIQEQPELFGGSDGVLQTLSDRSRQKMSGYAHIHESMLLIQGYAAAKAKGDPIATNIAFELTEILAFEAHEKKHNPSAPLAFGTIAALYHFEINKAELERDAAVALPHAPLRAKDIVYLLGENTVRQYPLENSAAIESVVLLSEPASDVTPSKTTNSVETSLTTDDTSHESEHIHDTTKERTSQVRTLETPSDRAHEIPEVTVSKKASAPRPSFEDVKAFTRDVKEQLIQDIEKVAVTLLGQPKRMEKNGIWHWSDGIRLHTRNGVVARGTFKNYSEGTDNIDVFGMIKQTQHFTHSQDAIKYGAQLCGMTLEGYDIERSYSLPVQAKSAALTKPKNGDDIWKPIFPVPEELEHVDIAQRPSLAFMLKDVGIETMRFAYRDENDRLLGYVVRLETEEGQKQTLPLTYCENGKGLAMWKWKGFGETTPLYGLDQLAHKPHAPVLLVEGEKAADAAQKLLPDMAVLSWVGGSAGVKKVDLTPLQDKTVVMWPDNDAPGAKAAATLAERFNTLSETAGLPHTFKVIDIPHEKLPQKWDLADPLPATMTLADIKTPILSALNTIEKSLAPSKVATLEHEKTEAPLEHIKIKSVDTLVSKPITFEEINGYAKACGIDFVPNAENMHFILHVANTTIKNLHNWHGVLDKACDHEQLRFQAISTGLYTAWAKNILESYKHEKSNIIEKSLIMGTFAARVKADQIAQQKTRAVSGGDEKHLLENREHETLHAQTLPDNHSIIAHARNSYKTFETDIQKQIESAPNFLRVNSQIEKEEIIKTMHHCKMLTGQDLKEPVVKLLTKALGETLNYDHHLQTHTKQREIVRGVIQHTIEQHGQGVKAIEPIHHEAAHHAHQQEQHHLQQAVQRVHTQTLHLEQQREMERQISRGIER